MKKLKLITMVAIVAAFSLSGCKKDKSLVYKSLSGSLWATGHVLSAGERVMWFQLFDNIEKQEKTVKSYSTKKKKVNGKYPATISDRMVWFLINDRIEIRLLADSKNKAYHGKDKLLAFANQFDLSGLEAISGPKKTGKELMAYAPKLKMAKK